MKRGDAFLSPDPTGKSKHLWIVLSDPALDAKRVLIVSVTTYHGGERDAECFLDRGDHSFLTHRSYLKLRLASITGLAHLRKALSRGVFSAQLPVASGVLDRIYRELPDVRFLPIECYRLLLSQGLIA